MYFLTLGTRYMYHCTLKIHFRFEYVPPFEGDIVNKPPPPLSNKHPPLFQLAAPTPIALCKLWCQQN